MQRRIATHMAFNAINACVRACQVIDRFLGMHAMANVGAKGVAVRILPTDDSDCTDDGKSETYQNQGGHTTDYCATPHREFHRSMLRLAVH
jgi:hypothetical protein